MVMLSPNNLVLNTTLYNTFLLNYEVMIRPKITSMADESITAACPDVDRKIENTVEGLPSECSNYLIKRVLPVEANKRENALIICDYISSFKSEINPSRSYKRDT
jgi:hypothetical protein